MTGGWGALAARLDGALILPGDLGMAANNKQFASALPLSEPQALLRCSSPADVQRGVAHAVEHDLAVTIRSGGHCFGDLSCGTGLVLDVSGMNAVRPEGERVVLGPGALAGDTAEALAAHDRAIATGGCPLVAMGGLALAGGFGFLGRRDGLTSDQIDAFEVVLADGRIVVADADSEPDLFWALRGGGALGFGVVTRLVARTQELAPLVVVIGRWSLDEAAALIADWQHWSPNADPAINLELGLIGSDFLEDPPFVELFGIVAGTQDEAAPHLAALSRRLGRLADRLDVWQVTRAEAARYCSGLLGHRLKPAWLPSRPYGAPGLQATRSHFFEEPLGRAAVEQCVRNVADDRLYSQYRELEFVPWGAAYQQGGGAFAHRDAHMLIRHTATVGVRSDENLRAHARAWTEASFAALDAHSDSRAYQGYAEPRRTGWHAACYGPALPRLLDLKQRYDPAGLFA
jgi:FAD/FMN-containing dehydrogenase